MDRNIGGGGLQPQSPMGSATYGIIDYIWELGIHKEFHCLIVLFHTDERTVRRNLANISREEEWRLNTHGAEFSTQLLCQVGII